MSVIIFIRSKHVFQTLLAHVAKHVGWGVGGGEANKVQKRWEEGKSCCHAIQFAAISREIGSFVLKRGASKIYSKDKSLKSDLTIV
jgi:hypothetical protein